MAVRVLLSTLGAPVTGALSDALHRRWVIMAPTLLLALTGMISEMEDQVRRGKPDVIEPAVPRFAGPGKKPEDKTSN